MATCRARVDAMRAAIVGRRRRGRERRVRADAARQPRVPARPAWVGASTAYRAALARFAGYAPARRGSRGSTPRAGDLASAIRRWRTVVARLPLPEYVVGLGEAELSAGRRAAARRDLALVGAEERLLAASGVDTDVDLAVFEASHGSPARGVELARRAWAAAPSVRSSDALGWALTRAGRPKRGTAPCAACARARVARRNVPVPRGRGRTRSGPNRPRTRWLRAALAGNPNFSPLYAPKARRMLEALR